MKNIPAVYELYEIVYTRGNTGPSKPALSFVDEYPSLPSARNAAGRGLPRNSKFVVFEKRCVLTNITTKEPK